MHGYVFSGRRYDTGDRRSHFMTQCQRPVVFVKELEHVRLQGLPVANGQRIQVFNGRRDYLIVAPMRKYTGQFRLDRTLFCCLRGQKIPGSIGYF